MVNETSTDSHLLKIIVSQLLRTDCDHKKIFTELGIKEYLHTPVDIKARLDVCWLETFINELEKRINDPVFFFKAGANAQCADFGDIGLLSSVCSNYRESVHYASKYQHYLRSNIHHHFFIDDDKLYSRVDSSRLGHSPAITKLVEVELCSIFAISRFITGSLYPINPTRIELKHSANASTLKYIEAMNAEVVFNCEHNQIVSLPITLEAPIYNADPELFRFFQKRLERGLKEASQAYLISDVLKGHLHNTKNLANYTMCMAAKSMGMSTSTLKRKLKLEETSFQEIIDTHRFDHAKRLLIETMESADDISRRLGFASYASFSRAFKSWSGMTPAKYRNIKHL